MGDKRPARARGGQLALGEVPERPAPEPEPEAPAAHRETRYRVRATEAVLLGPDGRVLGFGRKEDLTRTAAAMGEVIHE